MGSILYCCLKFGASGLSEQAILCHTVSYFTQFSFHLRYACSTYVHERPQSLIKAMLQDIAVMLSSMCFLGEMTESVNDKRYQLFPKQAHSPQPQNTAL